MYDVAIYSLDVTRGYHPQIFLNQPSLSSATLRVYTLYHIYNVTSTYWYAIPYQRTGAISLQTALLSVYDKTGLLPFAKGLKAAGFRLLGSGGTAKQIREAGIEIEQVVLEGD